MWSGYHWKYKALTNAKNTLRKTHFVPQSCAYCTDLQNNFLLNKEIYRVISKHASNCIRKTTFYYLMVEVTVKSSRFTFLKMNEQWTMNLLETFQFEVMSSRIIVALRQRYLHGGGLQWVLSEPLAIVRQ